MISLPPFAAAACAVVIRREPTPDMPKRNTAIKAKTVVAAANFRVFFMIDTSSKILETLLLRSFVSAEVKVYCITVV